ncbi:glycosyltransferase family 2 protein [uncultured Varibaculum sp.]|uniref:glycosyltransferase family 2 protein n=1 Tax=uncultured Varibaculum sp. TaxID=413896 RepID=UPI0028897EDF|nr:glycosyltransferase family 2 protein [uncultured Varibaculum sp.]
MQDNRQGLSPDEEIVYAVVVTYEPDGRVADLLHSLTTQVEQIIVIDNGSSLDSLTLLKEVCSAEGAQLTELKENTGIAHAQNVGINRALKEGADYVLLFDQDSLPQPDMVSRLVSFYTEMNIKASAKRLPPIAAVGPCILDSKGKGSPLVYVKRRWAPGKAKSTELTRPAVPVAFLLASGCLISKEALQTVGLMNEGYFIDHVDMEWCLRAEKQGYQLLVSTGSRLPHSFGDSTVAIPLLKRKVHVHAPVRSYYVVRNTIALCRTSLMPWRWRVRYLLWLIPYSAVNIFLTGSSREQLHWVVRGVTDGITARTGKAEHSTFAFR